MNPTPLPSAGPGCFAGPRARRRSRRSFLGALVCTGALACASFLAPIRSAENAPPTPAAAEPLFRFGVIADIQYADKPAPGVRQYRTSLAKLDRCVAWLNQQPLAFVANLGDIIDGNGPRSAEDLARVSEHLKPLQAPWRHVIGNHCLELDRAVLLPALGLSAPWYEFTQNGWRFLVLNGMDVSVKAPKDSPSGRAAREYLEINPKLPTYNGALGPDQLDWLKAQLAAARGAGQRVIVMCHHPVLPAASDASSILWNGAEVVNVLVEAGCVAAWFNGHDHRGGYAEHQGIHFVTFPGLVEAPADQSACAIVEVRPDRLVIQGLGTVPSRTLALRPMPRDSAGR